jgi:hypothetical protein
MMITPSDLDCFPYFPYIPHIPRYITTTGMPTGDSMAPATSRRYLQDDALQLGPRKKA